MSQERYIQIFPCWHSSAYYLQIHLFMLATLAYKLGPSLSFFGLPNFVLLRLLQQVGCRYTYKMHHCPFFLINSTLFPCFADRKLIYTHQRLIQILPWSQQKGTFLPEALYLITVIYSRKLDNRTFKQKSVHNQNFSADVS